MKAVSRIVNHVAMRVLMSIILVIAGLNEVLNTMGKDFSWHSIGAHHGILIFGLFQLMRALVEVVEGLRVATEEAEEVEEEVKGKSGNSA